EEESGDETVVDWDELVSGDLCLDALRYLHRCAAILESMHDMPACPVFHAAHSQATSPAGKGNDPKPDGSSRISNFGEEK
ncbi:hypothetical protein SK128_020781, partial [Halocaridina rubra]